MSFVKYALPALAIVGSAAAQSSVNRCSTSATLTIQNGGDATALASCTTYTGSIALATGTTGSISFDGVKQITGDFSAVNAIGLTTLGSSSLTTIGGDFVLTNMTILTGMNFPLLTNVGNINWETLPNLQGLSFTNTVQTVDSLSIQDTQLATLTGINLTTAGTIYVSNNRYLTDINMQLTQVTDMLTLQSNNNGGLKASFPDLIWASSMSISQVTSLNIDALQYVNDTLYVVTNNMQSLSAPNLTTVGGLSILNNPQLSNISFPQLASCANADLLIRNNPLLTGNISFPELTSIVGAVTVDGAYSAFSLPTVNQMAGIANLTSSADISGTCNAFNGYTTNGVLRGQLYCVSGAARTTGTASGTRAASTSTSTSTPASAAGRFEATSVVFLGCSALVAAVVALF